MKKLITTCVLLTALTMVSFAQSKATKSSLGSGSAATSTTKATTKATAPTPEQLAERHAKTIQAQYGLTAEQYKNIYNADLNYYTQEQQAKAAGGQPGPGQSMQMNMGREQYYQNTMTPEQFAKYQAANKQTK